MLHRHEYKSITWIDLESPTVDEIRSVTEEYNVHPVVTEELLSPTLRPHTEHYGDHLYLVLHFPALQRAKGSVPEQEVDFVIGTNVLITTRYEEMPSFAEFRNIFEMNAALAEDHLGDSPFDVFLILTKRLYKTVDVEIEEVRDTLEYIEDQIFKGREKEMVVSLSRAGRDILNLKQALDPHQDILSSLYTQTADFAGKEHASRVRSIENAYFRSRKHVTRIWQTLSELRETNNSLLSTKQNEVMKIFTILAFVTFPLSLIASIFGMNTQGTPFLGVQHDFWIIVSIMGFTTLLMFIYFRHKHWL